MERFHRQDNLNITLGKKPGRNICLEFALLDPRDGELLGNQKQVFDDIVARISTGIQWMDAPYHKRFRQTQPFIQSRTDDYLLIEFWTDDYNAIRDMVLMLAGKFDFDFTEAS